MAGFRYKLRFFAIVSSMILFCIQNSASSIVPSSAPGRMLSLLLVTTSWKVSYTNPPFVPIQLILPNVGNNTSEEGKPNVTEYGNHANLNASSGALGEKSTRRTGRKLLGGSESKTRARSHFHNTRSKEDRQGQNSVDQTSEAESLRRNILNQLGTVDPLLCLPKALCGISSRQKQSETASRNGQTLAEDDIGLNDVNNYLQLMQTVIPQDDSTSSKKKKKKRKSKASKSGFKNGESDSSQSSSSEESKEDDQSEELSRDDFEYYKEKAQMEKLISQSDYEQVPNWWESISTANTGPNSIDPFNKDGGSADGTGDSSGGGMWQSMPLLATGVTRLVRSMMPSMSWGFGNSKDVFGDDPFFQKREGRSLNGRNSMWSFGTKNRGSRNEKSRYKIKKRKKTIRRKAYLDERKGEIEQIDDPTEKFELAVEIGKQLDDPQQCEYIFNGCPFSYDEILAIIDSNSSQKPKVPEEPQQEEVYSRDQYHQSQEIETLPVTRTPSSRGKKRILKHKMPNGDHLEIRLKVSDSQYSTNGVMTVPKVSVIPNSETLEALTEDLNSEISPYEYNPPTADETDEKLSYRNDLPETQTSQESLKNDKEASIEVTTNNSLKSNKKQLRPKSKGLTRHSKTPKKKWGKQPVPMAIPNPIIPYLFNPPPSPPPHVTNYHYYSANGPNTRYTYEPNRPVPVSKIQPDEPSPLRNRPSRYSHKRTKPHSPKHSRYSDQQDESPPHRPSKYSRQPDELYSPQPSRYSHQSDEPQLSQPSRYTHQPNYQEQEYNNQPGTKYSQQTTNSQNYISHHQQKSQPILPIPVRSSEERIIIRVPETSNNNYYNMFTNPGLGVSSLFGSNYHSTTQPNYSMPHRPQSFIPSPPMYPPQPNPFNPQGPGPYPYPSYPSPSMLTYLFGKK